MIRHPLKDREQILVALCAGMVFFFAIKQGVIRPLRERSQNISEQIQTQRRVLKKDSQAILKAKNMEAKEAYYKELFLQRDNDEQTVSKTISEIEKEATQADLRISELKPAPMKNQGAFHSFAVTLVFDAPFSKVVRFLDIMQASPYYFSIDEMDAVRQMGGNNQDLHVSISLSKIFIVE